MVSFDSFNSLFVTKYKGKQFLDDDDEETLTCELMKIVGISNNLDYSHRSLSANIFLINLYELMQMTKDGNLLRTCLGILTTAIANEHNRTHLVRKMSYLPMLSNILATRLKKDLRLSVLNLIHDLCQGYVVKTTDGYVGPLLQNLATVVLDDDDDEGAGKMALAIIHNMCQTNRHVLFVLKDKVDIELLRQRMTLEQYGVLACKMVTLLSNIGTKLNEIEIRNFFTFFNSHIPTAIAHSDSISINHATSFFESFERAELSKDTLTAFSFKPIAIAVNNILTDPPHMEPTEKYNMLKHIYGLATAIILAKNKSFHSIFDALIDSAIQVIQHQTNNSEAIRICHTILETVHSGDMVKCNFDQESLVQNIRKVMSHAAVCPTSIIAALKLVSFLQTECEVNIMTEPYVESIIQPLSKGTIKYTEIHADVVTMYLQCLSEASKLLSIEQSAVFFEKKNVKYLIGMSIKLGNEEQINLALDCVQRQKISTSYLANIMKNVTHDETEVMSLPDTTLPLSSTLLMNATTPLASSTAMSTTMPLNDVTNALKHIDKANKENRLHQQHLSDFLKIYHARIAVLQKKNDAQKLIINDLNQHIISLTQTESVNGNMIDSLSELNISLQTKIEQVQSDLSRNEAENRKNQELFRTSFALTNKQKAELKSKNDQINRFESNETQMKKSISDLQSRLKSKEQRVLDLESEIEMNEDTRNKIIHLMAKRKK